MMTNGKKKQLADDIYKVISKLYPESGAHLFNIICYVIHEIEKRGYFGR